MSLDTISETLRVKQKIDYGPDCDTMFALLAASRLRLPVSQYVVHLMSELCIMRVSHSSDV